MGSAEAEHVEDDRAEEDTDSDALPVGGSIFNE